MASDAPQDLPVADGLTRHEVRIHMPGILKILGEALYSRPEVALRELIQNAHDSIVRRQVEGNAPETFKPAIIITPLERLRELWIEDNGSGLTTAEIHEFLATVGRGYTATLRENLARLDLKQAGELIGQFGLGLLSAFLVADEIVVDTRSAATGEAVLWRSDGDGTYTIEPGRRDEPGTTVRLKIKTLRREVLDLRFLHTVIQTYADFIPIPIYLESNTTPENAIHAPWHRADATRQDYQDFLEHRYPELTFLEIIPLADVQRSSADVDGRSRAEAPDVIPLSGVLAIPDTSTVSIREHGDVMVYVRRMLVEERCKELLPAWARFVTGVVESAAFQPTASRETIRRDEIFETVRDELGRRILQALNNLAETDPERFRQVIGVHNDLIKSWALECPELFPQVENLVLFETGQGPLTLPQIVGLVKDARRKGRLKSKGTPLYYVSDPMRSTQARLILEGRGVPVIDASHGWERVFLETYASRHPNVRVTRVQAGDHTLFAEPPEGTAAYASLLDACKAAGIRAMVSVFEPTQIPALLLFSAAEEELLDARHMAERVDVAGGIRRLLENLTGDWERRDPRPGTLALNTTHPLVQDLAALSGSRANDRDVHLILDLLYSHAALLEQRSMTQDGMVRLFEEATAALQHFLDTS